MLWYHNISPGRSHGARSLPDIASDLIRGRWELEQVRDRTVLRDRRLRVQRGRVAGLGLPRRARRAAAARRRPAARHAHRTRPSNGVWPKWGPPDARAEVVLVVGQQMPHKRIDRAVAGVAVLQQEYLPEAILAVTGVWRIEHYSAPLRAFAVQCGLERIEWLGRVTRCAS